MTWMGFSPHPSEPTPRCRRSPASAEPPDDALRKSARQGQPLPLRRHPARGRAAPARLRRPGALARRRAHARAGRARGGRLPGRRGPEPRRPRAAAVPRAHRVGRAAAAADHRQADPGRRGHGRRLLRCRGHAPPRRARRRPASAGRARPATRRRRPQPPPPRPGPDDRRGRARRAAPGPASARRARPPGRRRALHPRRLPRGRPPRPHPLPRGARPGRHPRDPQRPPGRRPLALPRDRRRARHRPRRGRRPRARLRLGPDGRRALPRRGRPGPGATGHRRVAPRVRRRACRRGVGRGGRPLMHPFPLAAAIGLCVFLVVRRRHLGRTTVLVGLLAAAGLALWGAGVVEPPSLTGLIEDVGKRLGKWTYLLVGALAFLETGAFVGLVAPGESAILVGGVVAGQGQISIYVLIGLVWACAVAGDLTSYVLGRRRGRSFLERHGPRVKITEERLRYVEDFFARRGGITILIGRFIGLVRAIAPFIAGASKMPLRTFLPYDVLGAGLWGSLFCLLGYFFWRSLDKVEAYIGKGAAAFTGLVVAGLAIWFVVRYRRDDDFRAKVQSRLERSPAWRRVRGPLMFAADHATFALELATLLSLAAVGTYVFFGLEALIGPSTLTLDQDAFDIADALYMPAAASVIRVATNLGSFPVTAAVVIATAI